MRPHISTGTGDDGTTGLLKGERVPKSALRIHAIGTVDELNSILGVVLSEVGLPDDLRKEIERVQRALFNVGADLASASGSPRLPAMSIGELEQWGAAMEQALPSLGNFILPGGSKIAALLHQARAVCRRAERWVVGLNHEGKTCGFPLMGTPFPRRLRSSVGARETQRFARSFAGSSKSCVSDATSQSSGVNTNVLVYLNRLSDCLFLAARMANRAKEHPEVEIRSPEPAAAPARSRN
ncbi:MAG: cob(I)yrinic acid a,c-diamide adenosyltransferase [Candidatus Peribacteraceae bacterium]|jgi:cob(I)alamin adenosyltransferase|nr:cob(I)yrinic acid a,c-diamide adenosyltransferase [Candidatus Peribacteraceae bacterium]